MTFREVGFLPKFKISPEKITIFLVTPGRFKWPQGRFKWPQGHLRQGRWKIKNGVRQGEYSKSWKKKSQNPNWQVVKNQKNDVRGGGISTKI